MKLPRFTLSDLLWLVLVAIQFVSAASNVAGDDSDYRKLVASLANRNPTPMRVDDPSRKLFLFASDFNWKEQARVVGVVKRVAANVAEAWPALIDSLDDERYCITVEGDLSSRNFTVGEVCTELVSSALNNGYRIPGYKHAYSQLRRPDYIPQDRATLKAWCLKQREERRTIAELQIEAAQWALVELPKLKNVAKEDIQEAVEETKSRIEQIRETGQPRLHDKFFGEGRVPYLKEDADRMRSSIEARQVHP